MAKAKQMEFDTGATLGFDGLFGESARLEKSIRKNLKAIGVEVVG